jgi:hypothetical protein
MYNGVLDNSSPDKRTTKDVFHIVDGGPTVSSDRKEIPRITFAKMLQGAFSPDDKMLVVPFTADRSSPVKLFGSNDMKPVICPKMEGIQGEKNRGTLFCPREPG